MSHDRTGRSKGSGRKVGGPPPGEGFVWHTTALLTSAAWRSRSINEVRLIEFLEIEHLEHGGVENGRLKAPYSRLVEFGIGRRFIPKAIKKAAKKGLIEVKRGGLKGRQMSEMNSFRLTYFWVRRREDGLYSWDEPTNDWAKWKPEISSPSCTVTVHLRELASVHLRELPPPKEPSKC